MENRHAIKFGKASISIRAIEKPWRTVSHNQRVSRTKVLMPVPGVVVLFLQDLSLQTTHGIDQEKLMAKFTNKGMVLTEKIGEI